MYELNPFSKNCHLVRGTATTSFVCSVEGVGQLHSCVSGLVAKEMVFDPRGYSMM